MKKLGAISECPYNINKDDYKNKNLKVIYNSVGSGGIYSEGIKRLKKADYIAVRDQRSVDYLKDKLDRVYLVPDSAIILSDVYPKNKRYGRDFSFIDKPYLFFQLSNHKYGGDEEYQQIIKQIKNILKNQDINIVMCPIGTAPGHNDDVILKKIKKEIKDNGLYYVDNPSIQEIAFLIAHSHCYIGTSLHGVITSMSYGVPYIGLNPKQLKLVSYNDTWSIEELKEICPITNFEKKLAFILERNQNQELSRRIEEKSEMQKKMYYESFDRIFSIITQ